MEQKKMIRAAVFAASTAVATMVINIPLPNVRDLSTLRYHCSDCWLNVRTDGWGHSWCHWF